MVVVLIGSLVLIALKHNIQFKAQHIPGKSNNIVDSMSRKQWEVFRKAAPNADIHPQPIPAQFQTLLFQASSIHC